MEVTLRAEIGRPIGSRPARRLRREGLVPAVVYGQDRDPVSVAVNARDLYAALHTDAGVNAIINLEVDGGETFITLAREVQRHPFRSEYNHVDFLAISLTETVTADVGLTFEGEPEGVRNSGGIVETLRNSISIEALPTAIPSGISLDISELDIGDSLKVSDLPEIEGVEYLDDPDAPIVLVALPAAIVAEEEEEGEEGEEGVEGEEGEGVDGDEGATEGSSDE